MKGSICKCGFKTISERPTCPSCGRMMEPHEFSDSGKVLSFVKLGVLPENQSTPMDLVMVEILDGPKIACWTNASISKDQIVKVLRVGGILRCEASYH